MIDAFGLGVVERWQVGAGRGVGFLQHLARELLQAGPSIPVHSRCMGDLPQQASPFNDHPVDVASPQEFIDPGLFRLGILVHRRHNHFGSGSVFQGESVFQIPGKRLVAVALLARDGQSSAPPAFIPRKPETRVQIRQFIDQFIQRMTRFLKYG